MTDIQKLKSKIKLGSSQRKENSLDFFRPKAQESQFDISNLESTFGRTERNDSNSEANYEDIVDTIFSKFSAPSNRMQNNSMKGKTVEDVSEGQKSGSKSIDRQRRQLDSAHKTKKQATEKSEHLSNEGAGKSKQHTNEKIKPDYVALHSYLKIADVISPEEDHSKSMTKLEKQLAPNKTKDGKLVVEKKQLRQQVKNFRKKDLMLKPVYDEEIKKLGSSAFVKGFDDGSSSARIGYTEALGVSSELRKLHMLWDDCFFSFQQRLDMLAQIQDISGRFSQNK